MPQLRYIFTAEMNIVAGGYDHEEVGVNPPATRQETSNPTGEQTYEYFYRDSNSADNANSSRVVIKLKDSWEVKMNSDNSLDVTVKTTVLDFRRDDVRGNPLLGSNDTREIRVTAGQNGAVIANISGDPINYAHPLSYNPGPFTTHYTIEPGGSIWRSPVFVHNHSTGRPVAYPYLDEMWCGVTIYNPNQVGYGQCIHYDANGGRDAPEDYCWTSDEPCTQYTLSSKEPWSPHWVFLGWDENQNATSPTYRAGQTITICGDMTLYAIYRYTYRPGMVLHGGVWQSCDRDGPSGPDGRCNILRGGTWYEMRIDPIHTGLDDPPCIEQNGAWRIQKLIGANGEPHHIKWDCPHQWH